MRLFQKGGVLGMDGLGVFLLKLVLGRGFGCQASLILGMGRMGGRMEL